MSVDEWFTGRPPAMRRVFEAVARHLRRLGQVHVEAVGVGILFKRERTFVELRPKRDRLALSFIVSRVIESPRIARRIAMSPDRVAHFVDVRDAREVDDELKEWLAESHSGPLP